MLVESHQNFWRLCHESLHSEFDDFASTVRGKGTILGHVLVVKPNHPHMIGWLLGCPHYVCWMHWHHQPEHLQFVHFSCFDNQLISLFPKFFLWAKPCSYCGWASEMLHQLMGWFSRQDPMISRYFKQIAVVVHADFPKQPSRNFWGNCWTQRVELPPGHVFLFCWFDRGGQVGPSIAA